MQLLIAANFSRCKRKYSLWQQKMAFLNEIFYERSDNLLCSFFLRFALIFGHFLWTMEFLQKIVNQLPILTSCQWSSKIIVVSTDYEEWRFHSISFNSALFFLKKTKKFDDFQVSKLLTTNEIHMLKPNWEQYQVLKECLLIKNVTCLDDGNFQFDGNDNSTTVSKFLKNYNGNHWINNGDWIIEKRVLQKLYAEIQFSNSNPFKSFIKIKENKGAKGIKPPESKSHDCARRCS